MSLPSKPLAFLYEIRPLPMLATLLSAVLGAIYGGLHAVNYPLLGYLAAVFAALYCGHLIDSLIDYHHRGEKKFVYMGIFEDSGGILSARALTIAATLASLTFVVMVMLITSFGTILFWVAFCGWVIAVTYSPLLDKNPFTVSIAYPLGTTLAMIGGYLLTGANNPNLLMALTLPIFLYLIGGKVVSDLIDYKDDIRIGKHTVVVVLSPNKGRLFGYFICSLGLTVAFFDWYVHLLPPFSVFGVCAASLLLITSYCWRSSRSVLVLVGGGYVFLAFVIASLLAHHL